MASGTADLQRDLGGAIMQSIMGALLTAGYASAVGRGDRCRTVIGAGPDHGQRPESADQVVLECGQCRSEYPKYSKQITAAAQSSFVDGADWAYLAGVVAILVGAAVVFFLFPHKQAEERLLEEFHAIDTAA